MEVRFFPNQKFYFIFVYLQQKGFVIQYIEFQKYSTYHSCYCYNMNTKIFCIIKFMHFLHKKSCSAEDNTDC